MRLLPTKQGLIDSVWADLIVGGAVATAGAVWSHRQQMMPFATSLLFVVGVLAIAAGLALAMARLLESRILPRQHPSITAQVAPLVSPPEAPLAAALEAQEPQEVPPPQPEPPPQEAPPVLPPEIAQRVREFVEAERARAFFWEYQFLNRFLALHTQHILDWLINLGQRTTLQTYDAFWMQRVPDARERIVVLDTLRNHHLVNVDGHLVEVTPKGHEYAQWRGAMPPPHAAPEEAEDAAQ